MDQCGLSACAGSRGRNFDQALAFATVDALGGLEAEFADWSSESGRVGSVSMRAGRRLEGRTPMLQAEAVYREVRDPCWKKAGTRPGQAVRGALAQRPT